MFPSEIIPTEELLGELQIWNVTSTIAKQAGWYWQQYIKRLKNLHIIDCLLAATAKIHDLTLVTLNTRHFPMKDIKIMGLGR